MYENVAIPKTCTLRFEVWDEDVGSADDSLGKTEIEFDPTNGILTPGVYDQHGFKFFERELKDKHGKVVVRKMNDQVSKLKLGIRLHHTMDDMGHQQMVGQPMMNKQYSLGQQGMLQPMMNQPERQPMANQQMMGQPMMNYPMGQPIGNQRVSMGQPLTITEFIITTNVKMIEISIKFHLILCLFKIWSRL